MEANQTNSSSQVSQAGSPAMQDFLSSKGTHLWILGYTIATMFLTASFFLAVSMNMQSSGFFGVSMWPLFLIGFLLFLFWILVGFWIANRIAGPIQILERHMKAVIDGKPASELRLRAGDQFQSTAGLYNQLLRHLGLLGNRK